MSEYYCQLALGNKWEKVDRFTFNNAQRALTREGFDRYSGSKVKVEDGLIEISGILTVQELAAITRLVGAEGKAPLSLGQGFVVEPDYIKFSTPKGSKIHEVQKEAA